MDFFRDIFSKKTNAETLGQLPEGEMRVQINQEFLDSFTKDAKEGKTWCEHGAMHWAEILTFSFSHMIITFDLGILAFVGVMQGSFLSHALVLSSTGFALISLLLLTFFVRGVIVKNINSLRERREILNYTLTLAPKKLDAEKDANEVVRLLKKQATSLETSHNKLDKYVKYWMPIQRIGLYFFYFSILSVLLGIIL